MQQSAQYHAREQMPEVEMPEIEEQECADLLCEFAQIAALDVSE